MTFCEICGRVMTGKFQLGENVICKDCVAEFSENADLTNPEEVEKIRKTMEEAIGKMNASGSETVMKPNPTPHS